MNWDSDCGTMSYSEPESLAKERSCQGARVPLRAARQTPSLGEATTARLCCHLVWKDLRLVRAARWWTASAMFIIATLASTSGARAAGAVDRTNVPLKNWGGFAEYRDSVYDDLERLVTAGLADRVLLNTKPLSRVEVARLITGYVKLTLFNFELMYGRDSLAWGPGYHNSLILGNKAPPLEQIRLGSAEPFLLPWIGQWVGPMKAMIFLAQLEERRDHPFAKLSGMRITSSPASFLELGFSRAVMFDGCCPYLPLSKYPAAIFDPGFGDVRTNPEERTNNLTSTDFEFRFRNVDRYLPISRDLRLYGEFYWDDTCGECVSSGGG